MHPPSRRVPARDPLRRWHALLLSCLCAVAASVTAAAPPGALATIEGRVASWPIPAARAARDPKCDREGNVFIAIAGADRVARFDPKTRQFREWPLPAGSKPHGIAIGESGKVYFASNAEGWIGELDVVTGALRRFPTSSASSRLYSTALDSEGNLWATAREGRLVRLTIASGTVTEYAMDGEPYGVVVDGEGVVWVTLLEADKVTSFDPRTRKRTDISFPAGSKPRGLDVAKEGALWVSLYGSGKLAKVDRSTHQVVKEYAMPGGPIAGPYSVRVDARGRVWVVEFQTDSIAILNPRTEKFRIIRLPQRGWGARNADLDAQGRYWVIGTTRGTLGLAQ